MSTIRVLAEKVTFCTNHLSDQNQVLARGKQVFVGGKMRNSFSLISLEWGITEVSGPRILESPDTNIISYHTYSIAHNILKVQYTTSF